MLNKKQYIPPLVELAEIESASLIAYSNGASPPNAVETGTSDEERWNEGRSGWNTQLEE